MGLGLNVAKEKGRHIFAGAYWYMTIRGDVFPKKAKAAAIELIGEFPASGENFVIRNKEEKKMGEFNKKWMETVKSLQQLPEEDLFYKTNITLEDDLREWRLWQNTEKEIIIMECLSSDIVSIGNINENYENPPEGPYKLGTISTGSIMYWGNNACDFFVLAPQINTESNEEFFREIQKIYLPGITRREN